MTKVELIGCWILAVGLLIFVGRVFLRLLLEWLMWRHNRKGWERYYDLYKTQQLRHNENQTNSTSF